MALVPDQKFSTFQNGNDLIVGDIIVGLRNGLNTRFTYTGELPPTVVVPISSGGTGATTAAGARSNLGLGTLAVQNASAVAITGGTVSGVSISSSTAALLSGTIAAVPSSASDITNKSYVDSMVGGSVASVTGTLNRITSTGGINPVIDISASYVGQSSITTLGTIATGVWQGTLIGSTYGGTGVNNGSSTLTMAASHTLSGAFASTFTFTGITGVTFPTSGTLATTSQLASPAALTRVDDTNVTLTLGGTPASALLQATSLTLGWTGQLSIARGGTAVSSVTIAPTASAWAGWDANSNLSANSFLAGFATTATAAGTTVLTVASAQNQEFTGVTTQTVTLPVVSTLATGREFFIINNSTGALTVNSSGGNLVLSMAANTTGIFKSVLNTGTTAASWNASYIFDNGAGVSSITGTANQVIASASTGAVTLSLPQSIATSSDVTFNSMTWNDYTKGILGTTANNDAAAGYVGEVISSTVSAAAITSGVVTNITTLSLTAGDWDIMAACCTNPAAGTTTSLFKIGINTTSATFPAVYCQNNGAAASFSVGYSAPTTRVRVNTNTTVYLVLQITYAVSTLTTEATIYARRRR